MPDRKQYLYCELLAIRPAALWPSCHGQHLTGCGGIVSQWIKCFSVPHHFKFRRSRVILNLRNNRSCRHLSRFEKRCNGTLIYGHVQGIAQLKPVEWRAARVDTVEPAPQG